MYLSQHNRGGCTGCSDCLINITPPLSYANDPATTISTLCVCDASPSAARVVKAGRSSGGAREVTSAPCPQWLGRCVAKRSAQQLLALNRASHSPLCLWVPVECNVSHAGVISHHPDVYLPHILLSLLLPLALSSPSELIFLSRNWVRIYWLCSSFF